MKPNELRIGNWVTNEADKRPVQMGGAGICKLHEYRLPTEYSPIPIPLTEEWLLKFGFSEGELTGCFQLDISARISLRFIDGRPNCLDLVQDNERISMRWGCCYYVHQLQNLYFALTGEELAIKNIVPN